MKSNSHKFRPASIAAAIFFCTASLIQAASYYVHPTLGKDSNAGTSPEAPLQSLARASGLKLQAGDQVLLAAGKKFAGQLAYEGLQGEATKPILISSYAAAPSSSEVRVRIDAKGCLAGVYLKNCAHFEIRNLQITADAGAAKLGAWKKSMRCGVLIEAEQPGEFAGFTLTNLVVKDIFYEAPGFVRSPEEVKSANGTQRYGYGIRLLTTADTAVLKNIFIADCQIENIEHTGLKLTASGHGLQNVDVQRVRVSQTGGPGVQMSGVQGGHFSQLDVNGSGSTNDSRKWGRGSGLWTWGTSDVIIEKSQFQNANGPGDSAGVHIDYNCRNVIVQQNFSANNAGGFCEILGNNHNCAYRYNVSVNDGARVKGKHGAFQEGKVFWLSGYAGDKSPRRGPFNTYFYNNTIYVGENIVAKVAVTSTAQGVLVANNIFCFQGRSASVEGDQNRRDVAKAATLPNVVFQNNLYLRAGNWPAQSLLQDHAPIVGDPKFRKAGGNQPADYLPQNVALIKDRGIPIHRLPQDEIGLVPGLKVTADILGRPMDAHPDIGAIELE